MAARFDITRPAISRHHRILREAGLVSMASSGRSNVYRLNEPGLREAEEWLRALWQGRLANLKRLAEESDP